MRRGKGPATTRECCRGPSTSSVASLAAALKSGAENESLLNLCRRTVNLRRPERARNEGSTGPERVGTPRRGRGLATTRGCCRGPLTSSSSASPSRRPATLTRSHPPYPVEQTRVSPFAAELSGNTCEECSTKKSLRENAWTMPTLARSRPLCFRTKRGHLQGV